MIERDFRDLVTKMRIDRQAFDPFRNASLLWDSLQFILEEDF